MTEASPPFEGYDGLDEKQVASGLSRHSQVELEAVESYERSHKGRDRVLDKLRYMRGREPMPGYDELEPEAIVTALGEADISTIRRVRVYERKFAGRSAVLDAAESARRSYQAAHPRGAGPKVKPLRVKHKPSRHGPGGVRRNRASE